MFTYTLQVQEDVEGTPTIVYYTIARAMRDEDADAMATELAERFGAATGRTVVGVSVKDEG